MTIAATAIHRAKLAGPGVWRGDSFHSSNDWTYRLRPRTIEEADRAMRTLRARGLDTSRMTAADFPLPSFERDAQALRRELRDGRGFVVLKGLPIERYSSEEATLIYWGISRRLGTPVIQNVRGDTLYSVRDEGVNLEKEYGNIGARTSKTSLGLNFHTDSAPMMAGQMPDLVALLALQVAKSGGASAIVSARTVHNILLEERPHHLERLYQPFHFDRRAELPAGESPTLYAPVFRADGGVEGRYLRMYIPKGHELAGEPLREADIAALDSLDAVMARPELVVKFDMERGDMQYVNNRFILHARTAFEDWPEPERKRHLVRLWLVL